MSNKSRRIFALIAEYAKNVEGIYKHAACITIGGKIVGIGVNDSYYHAEHNAIKNCGLKKLCGTGKAKIYVIRVASNGGYAMSKPCVHCLNTIKKYKIRCLLYTDCNLIVSSLTKHVETVHVSYANRKLLKT